MQIRKNVKMIVITLPALGLVCAMFAGGACVSSRPHPARLATQAPAPDASKRSPATKPAAPTTNKSVKAKMVAEEEASLPGWDDFAHDHSLRCMSKTDERSQPELRLIAGQKFRIEGSLLSLETAVQYPVRIGIVSAIKDSEDDTLANLDKAFAEFKKAGVQLVIANGDLSLQQFDLEDVMNKLGDSGLPVFVLIGNSESRSAFNRAFLKAEAKHRNLFNLNWNRHVSYGPLDFVSLPGYYDGHFLGQNSGCQYRPRDVEDLLNLCSELQTHNRRIVLISHGPPRSRGRSAIDYAFEAGNVGDPAMTNMIEDYAIGLGLFGHILEAGGRGCQDLRTGKVAVASKDYAKLYVNAGSASATPWGMHNGKESHGLAMIVVVDAKGAQYRVVKLRK